MELRHLRYFVAVAEERSFTSAARRLRVAQPALSRQIKDLEEELGVALFTREHRRVDLTASGEVFLDRARRLLADASSSVQAARAAAGIEARRLTIGFLGSYHLRFLEPALKAFRDAHPHLDIDFLQGTLEQQLAALRDRRIDIAFFHLTGPISDMDHVIVQSAPFMAAIPKGHPLAKRRVVAVQDLAHEDWVLCPREARPEFYDKVMTICAEAGFKPRVVRSVAGPPNNITGLVSLGMGVSLMPKLQDTLGSPKVVWRKLPDPAPMLEFALVWMHDQPPAGVREFVEIAVEALADAPGRNGAQELV